MSISIEEALSSNKEKDTLDFKDVLDVKEKGDWIECIKDIIAMANTKGGIIVFGLDDFGVPTQYDVEQLLQHDPADITNKIYSYTNHQFSNFRITSGIKDGSRVAVMAIERVPVPIVFTRAGAYRKKAQPKKEVFAFREGTVYFRHGAKSEPGNMDDIREVIDRRLTEIREEWLSGIQKVVTMPEGMRVALVPSDVRHTESPDAFEVRITDNPTAPEYRFADPNSSHPYQQKDILKNLNKIVERKLGRKINFYDILAINKVNHVEDNPIFYFRPKSGSTQYSQDYLDWLLNSFRQDNSFFELMRRKYSLLRRKS